MAARRDRNGHGLVAVRVTGALLPPDFLQTIARLEAAKQSGADYGLSKSLVLKDEIARYWRIANDLYAAYVERRQRADLDAQVTGVDEWLAPLFRDVLGYGDISRCDAIAIDGQVYPITDLALDRTVPLLFTTRDVSLDRADAPFGDEGRRRAPYGVVQELLNADDDKVWGFVSNGTTVRLLHDNPSLTRPAYIEADLERIFEEQIYADFSALWLTFHASRLRAMGGKPSACILEAWREEAHEVGERALEHLRDGVTTALRELGNGFLRHPDNESLRASLANGTLTSDTYFQELLRLVYRLLFLFATEDRHLLHSPTASDEQRLLYRDGYSVSRLRDRAVRRRHYDRHSDLWQSLAVVFDSLAGGGAPLGLPALGGLFSTDQCATLDAISINNNDLLEAIRALAFFRTSGFLARVNYRDMGTEELGSVYESLLELHPYIDVKAAPWSFGLVGEDNGEKTKGSARKVTGSYYTPAPLVEELVRSTVEPVMRDVVKAQQDDPRRALLDLKVIDPACGSGHFLLAAARRIAVEIACIEADSDTPEESLRQHALREVVQHCIYGVDRNALAVELCRTALWMEAVEPGKPLTFLEPHIQCGDSLNGVVDPVLMVDRVPDDAYKPLPGDDVSVCRFLKRRSREVSSSIQGSIFDQTNLADFAAVSSSVETMPEDTVEQVARKSQAWEAARSAIGLRREELRAHLFVAAFFAPKDSTTAEYVPISEDLQRAESNLAMRKGVEEFAERLAVEFKFLHWHIAFPEIMRRGGFDVVIGNPPWDVSQIKEEEYFSARAPEIAKLTGGQRTKAIKSLSASNPLLFMAYQSELHRIHASNAFARAGRYPLTARGKINSYALFAETFLALLSPRGRAGLIVPTGIATDESTSAYFNAVTTSHRLVSLIDFENREGLFPAVHNSQKFGLLTIGAAKSNPLFVFFARNVSDVNNVERRVSMSTQDIALLNPNTRTASILRSTTDAELAKKLYRRTPVLINKNCASSGNPWHVEFRARGLFNTPDRGLFRTHADFAEEGAIADGINWRTKDGQLWLPLFEPRMIDFYDHRSASYATRGEQRGYRVLPKTTEEQHRDPFYEPQPFYWVKESDVRGRLPETWNESWLLGVKGVTAATNERTVVPAFLPCVAVDNNMPLLFPRVSPTRLACLIANLASMVLDYCARQKVGSTFLSSYYIEQLPIIPPERYNDADMRFIVPRVIELSYTSESMRPLARQLGCERSPFEWNSDRRRFLRAELDAYYASLYGLSHDELRFILDPADVRGPEHPSETFRVLKEREIKEYGEYRTARLVLDAWNGLSQNDGLAPSA